MKKQLLKLSAVFAGLFIFGMVAKAQHEAPVRSFEIPYATGAITIDGVGDEASYGAAEVVTAYWNPVPPIPLPARDLGGQFQACYDDNNIYIFAHVTDDTACDLTTGNQWEFDNIEIFCDLDTTINLVSNLGSYNQGADASTADALQMRWNRGDADSTTGSAARNTQSLNNFALTENNTSWDLEVAIPFLAWMPEGNTIADLAAYVDKAMGFDVSFADSDKVPAGAGARTGQMAWDDDINLTTGSHADCDNAWHDTRTFGAMTLGAKPTPGAIKNIDNTNINVYVSSNVLNVTNVDNASSIVIYNTVGQVVKTISSVDASSAAINISDLRGAYIVKISLNNGDVVSTMIAN